MSKNNCKIKQKEYIILVDQKDNEIGTEEKLKVHEKGLLHRAFSVFLFRGKNYNIELLLQKREKNKYHCGGLWTNTCCSHVRHGEFLIEAGKRRLKEEMGIELKKNLIDIGSFYYEVNFDNGLIEHEIDHVLLGAFDLDTINFNPNEVESTRWITLDRLNIEYRQHPEKFTPWFMPAFKLAKGGIHKL